MSPPHDQYELFAVRYARMDRTARDNFVRPPGDAGATTMDYFVWVARNHFRTIVIDTGFAPEDAGLRGRTALHPVKDGLAQLDIDPKDVTDVVLTHLHNDHAGGTALFANATFHLQEREMRYATGPATRHPAISHAYDAGDLTDVIMLTRDRRVTFYDGIAPIAAGLTGHLLGGHTAGTQGVKVQTGRGSVFLASDLAHYYANFVARNPFPVLHNMLQLLDGYDAIEELVADVDNVIPGHDPLVLQGYEAPSDDLANWIVRLDVAPGTACTAAMNGTTAGGPA